MFVFVNTNVDKSGFYIPLNKKKHIRVSPLVNTRYCCGVRFVKKTKRWIQRHWKSILLNNVLTDNSPCKVWLGGSFQNLVVYFRKLVDLAVTSYCSLENEAKCCPQISIIFYLYWQRSSTLVFLGNSINP